MHRGARRPVHSAGASPPNRDGRFAATTFGSRPAALGRLLPDMSPVSGHWQERARTLTNDPKPLVPNGRFRAVSKLGRRKRLEHPPHDNFACRVGGVVFAIRQKSERHY
jgi:hypothetical protein